MKKLPWAWILLSVVFLQLPTYAFQRPPSASGRQQSDTRPGPAAYLGFDRNDYPGDANLPALRKSFAFTGYWLSNPPGERASSWHGKRTAVERAGFGFLLLFNGRDYAQLESRPNPGATDGAAAARSALSEGFPRGSVIFLDQEQGGRMLPEQKRYVFAWAEAVRRSGFRPGIYCSGIEVAESDGGRISTAGDLHDSPQGRQLVFWIANDACPPSPGCSFPRNPPPPEASGAPFAEVWQFAQSPVRSQFAAACRQSYNPDGNCYAPEVPGQKLHLDVSSSRSPDPSHGRQAPAAGGPSPGPYPPSARR
jgi:Domain of unknown function (DUF1906)